MPNIQRQGLHPIPPPSNTRNRTPTNKSSSAWDLIDTIRLLLYGESGTGKTTFWATFPGPIMAAICSGGNKPGELRSINTPEYRKKIDARVISASSQFKDVIEEARKGGHQTLVLDHVSGLQDLVLKEILGIDELPAQKHWGLAKQQDYGQCTMMCKEFLRSMLNLPCNVVIVGQERTFGGKEDEAPSDDMIKPTVGVAVTPSLAGWLNPSCDYVIQMFKRPKMREVKRVVGKKTVVTHVKEKGVEYCARTEVHECYMTKFRIPGGVKVDAIVDPTYDKLNRIIKGEE